MTWSGASGTQQAAQGSYDNDEWAKQAYGSDYDSRWGKSYDSVSAKSYANESYARKLRADDDQWAEDYDRYDDKDGKGYGAAASSAVRDADKKHGNAHGSHGYGAYGATEVQGGARQGASKAGYGNRMARSAYDVESYDEWDNKDDKWGAQAWGKDRDIYGASSVGQAAPRLTGMATADREPRLPPPRARRPRPSSTSLTATATVETANSMVATLDNKSLPLTRRPPPPLP